MREITTDEILADNDIYNMNKKRHDDCLEVKIGDGMEFTIHGKLFFSINHNELMDNFRINP